METKVIIKSIEKINDYKKNIKKEYENILINALSKNKDNCYFLIEPCMGHSDLDGSMDINFFKEENNTIMFYYNEDIYTTFNEMRTSDLDEIVEQICWQENIKK